MTTQGAKPAEVVEFNSTRKERASITFTIDGIPIVAHQPKTAFMLELGKWATGEDQDIVRTIDRFIDEVFSPEHAQILRDRLSDNDDDFDIDDLSPIMEWLEGQWSARPTGKPAASRTRRGSPGRRSTARAR